MRTFQKRKPFRSKEYLSFVRGHECCSCGKPPPNVAHHYMKNQGGMGTKVDDTYTVPLCTSCHNQWHTTGRFGCYELAADPRTESVLLTYKTQAELLARWVRMTEARATSGATDDVF
jgi:hypothetical protein